LGKLGGDDLGCFFLNHIKNESIDTDSVIIQKNALNQFAFIIIEKQSGERTILWQRDKKLNFEISEIERDSICSGKILHLDGYDSAAALYAASLCHENGIPVCIDLDVVVPNCKKLMEKIDFHIVSKSFCTQFTGISDAIEAFRMLNSLVSGFLVMTLGAEGAVAFIADKCLQFPGNKVKALDTTGAGDIFHGGFLYGLLQNWPFEKIMAFSNAAAGLSCEYFGAQSGIRPVKEILHSLETEDLYSYQVL
jgi:sulfofructose kinase